MLPPSSHSIIAELSADIAYALDVQPDGSLVPVWTSGAVKSLTGFTAEELPTRCIFELIHSSDESTLAEHRARLLAGQTSTVEYRIHTKTGDIRWFCCRAQPQVDETGRVVQIIGVLQDITKRKQAEDALAASQRFNQHLIDTAPSVLYLLDLSQRRNRYVSRRVTDVLGYTPEEVEAFGSELFSHAIYPADLPRLHAHFERLASASDEVTLDIEYRMRTKQGEWRWFRSWDRIFTRNEAGAPEVVLGAALDVTRVKQVEQALRQSEERFRTALQSSSTVVYTTDKELRYSWIYNPRAAFTVNEVLGKRDEDLLPPESAAHLTAFKRGVLESGVGGCCEMAIQGYGWNGYYEIFAEPLRDEDNHIIGLTVAAIDISERKRQEEKLRQHAVTLEERVAQRTAELVSSKNQLNEIATLASHELKAQLRSMDNLSTWLAEDTRHLVPMQSQQHLKKLHQRVKRLAGMVEDFIAYLRAARHPVDSETVDTTRLVTAIYQSLAPATFTISTSPLPVLVTHRSPLEIILRNLIDNAIKHHNRSNGNVTIAASDQGDYIEFIVSDDGPGIPATLQPQIFKIFRTLQPRDQIESSGMGLPIVRKVVETYGGTVRVESAVGRGTTFRFTWPKQIDPH